MPLKGLLDIIFSSPDSPGPSPTPARPEERGLSYYVTADKYGCDYLDKSINYAEAVGGEPLVLKPNGATSRASKDPLTGERFLNQFLAYPSRFKNRQGDYLPENITGDSDCHWPNRLFRVEGNPDQESSEFAWFYTIRVVEEVPEGAFFGPHGSDVMRVFREAEAMTPEQRAEVLHAYRMLSSSEIPFSRAARKLRKGTWHETHDVSVLISFVIDPPYRQSSQRNLFNQLGRMEATKYETHFTFRELTWAIIQSFLSPDELSPEESEALRGPWEEKVKEFFGGERETALEENIF